MTEKAGTKRYSRNIGRLIGDLAPYCGLVLVIIVFAILTKGQLLGKTNLQSMANNVVVTAICTIGAVFVFAAGYFDMSIGGSACITAVVGGLAVAATGNLWLGAIVILAVSLSLGLIKGLLAAYVSVPFFIFTIIMASIFSAFVLVILGDESLVMIDNAPKPIPIFTPSKMSAINFSTLAVFFVLCLVIFKFTPMGVKVKNMGGNILAARQSGIAVKKTTFMVFLLSALGIALAAFLILLRTRAVNSSTAATVSNDVMVALVLGGMPLSGGPRSKITAGIVGAATITVLNSGLTILGMTAGQIQICRGLIFIVVVLVSSLSYRGKLLPR